MYYKYITNTNTNTWQKYFTEKTRTYSHKLNRNFSCENTKLFAAKFGKLTSEKYISDIITNGLKLDFKEISKNRHYPFTKLKYDELNIVTLEVEKLLKKGIICKTKKVKNGSIFFTCIKRMEEHARF